MHCSWWTATSWSAYYRRWNQVVGDWLHSYVYNDLQRAGMVRSKAEAGVFIASAFIHELILAWYVSTLLTCCQLLHLASFEACWHSVAVLN